MMRVKYLSDLVKKKKQMEEEKLKEERDGVNGDQSSRQMNEMAIVDNNEIGSNI